MKVSKNLNAVMVSMLLVAGLAACEKDPGPAESAGKQLDQSLEKAGDKINEAGKQLDQSVDKAGQKINEAGDKVAIKMAEQSDKAGVAMDDAGITAKVKAAIFAEEGLKTLQISVDTVHGVVTLSGSVDNREKRDLANSLASAVSGVSSVNNKLIVK